MGQIEGFQRAVDAFPQLRLAPGTNGLLLWPRCFPNSSRIGRSERNVEANYDSVSVYPVVVMTAAARDSVREAVLFRRTIVRIL